MCGEKPIESEPSSPSTTDAILKMEAGRILQEAA
jgi:hypothetical protein